MTALAAFFLQDTKKKINLFTEKIRKKNEEREKNQIRNEINKIIIFKYI